MASNFKITRNRNNHHLHLKLKGDFDGSSAFELIHALEKNDTGIKKIYIDTCNLSSIQSFGQAVFLKNFHLPKEMFQNIIFTGEFSDQITPKGATGSYQNHKKGIQSNDGIRQ
jgi:anti-anti-sigma regulatory factor